MTDLSDYKRMVSDPTEKALRDRIRQLAGRVEELEQQITVQHAYSIGLGIVQERERIIRRIETEYGSELVRTVSIGQLLHWVRDA